MFRVAVPHKLSEEEALRRIQDLMAEMKERYSEEIHDLHEEWAGNSYRFSLSAKGFSVSGEMKIEADQVVLSAKLPLAARLFQRRIEKAIKERAETFFA